MYCKEYFDVKKWTFQYSLVDKLCNRETVPKRKTRIWESSTAICILSTADKYSNNDTCDKLISANTC